MTSQTENIEEAPVEETMVENAQVETLVNAEYEHGFVTDIETDTVAPGLNEDVIRLISKKKEEPEWLLQWRLDAYQHWLTMDTPEWAVLDDEALINLERDAVANTGAFIRDAMKRDSVRWQLEAYQELQKNKK